MFVALLLGSLTLASSPVASSVGRPSGTKAAPYLPTTLRGATSTSLVVAPGRVVIDGKGFGHGVGLAQDGAFWMGKAGKSVGQILALFFPGTTLSKRGGAIRIPLASLGSMTVVLPSGGSAGGVAVPAGGSVRAVAGSGVVSVNLAGSKRAPANTQPADRVSGVAGTRATTVGRFDRGLGFSGRFGVSPGEPIPADPTNQGTSPIGIVTSTTVQAESLATTVSPEIPVSGLQSGSDDVGPVDTIQTLPGAVAVTAPVIRITAARGGVVVVGAKQFRGTIEFIAKSQGMKVVNELDVEQYLRGMAEVTDPRWPAAALQAQAVVARTYALRMMGTRGEVCPTQACQVYVGAQAEYPAMDAAIAATAGKVVVYEGELANTFYSASGGGTMADPSEVFGNGTPIPYLKAGTYPTGDPKAWRVELSVVELGRRVGYPGALYDVVVSKVGPSGRAVEVTFVGSSGARSMPGPTLDRILGLRSTNFSVVVGRSDPLSSTVPITGEVVALDVGQVEESALDFQSGVFGDETTRPVASLTSLTTVTTTVAPASLSTASTSATAVSAAMNAVSSLASTTSSIATGSQTPVVESAAGVPGGSVTQSGRLATVILGGLVSLVGIGWALKWAMRQEGHSNRQT